MKPWVLYVVESVRDNGHPWKSRWMRGVYESMSDAKRTQKQHEEETGCRTVVRRFIEDQGDQP